MKASPFRIGRCCLHGMCLYVAVVAGCASQDEPVNGHAELKNATDRTVIVYYAKERQETSGDDVYVALDWDKVAVEAGDTERVEMQGRLWYGQFDAVYAGIVKQYDVVFNLLDEASLRMTVSDFLSEADAGCASRMGTQPPAPGSWAGEDPAVQPEPREPPPALVSAPAEELEGGTLEEGE